MKHHIAFRWLFLMLILFTVFSMEAQPPQKMNPKLILTEEGNNKIKQSQVLPLSDTVLLKKGYQYIKAVPDLHKYTQRPGSRVPRFTLRELVEREENNGYHPFQSPMFFQENRGQTMGAYKYILQNMSSLVLFKNNGYVAYAERGPASGDDIELKEERKVDGFSMEFVNARGELNAMKEIQAPVSIVKGGQGIRNVRMVKAYNYLVAQHIYPGISVAYQAKLGRLEYQLMLEPGSDIRKVKMKFKGVRQMTLDSKGNLLLKLPGRTIVQTRPRMFELDGKDRKQVKGSFQLLNQHELGFTVQRVNHLRQLLIDPEIVFTTYFGGSANDAMLGPDNGSMDFIGLGYDTKIGQDGDIYITGKTMSTDFPASFDQTGTLSSSGGDAFVLRVDPNLPIGSNLVYATIFGGSQQDNARSIEVMQDGSAYVTGFTGSADFPVSEGVVQPIRMRSGAFILKFLSNGQPEIGTFIGKALSNHPNSIVFNKDPLEQEGFLYVGGSSRAGLESDATPGTFQVKQAGGDFDGFVVKINLTLTQYQYFTYIGGTGRDVIMDIDVKDGFAFATGMTASSDFPTTDLAFQKNHSSTNTCQIPNSSRTCAEAFVVRLNQEGTGLIYSTYLGEAGREDYARGIAVNNNKQAYITGASAVPGSDRSDIFVAKLEGGGENLLWKSTVQGIQRDHGEELIVDRLDRVFITGTISVDGRSTGLDASIFHGGRSDMFYCRMNASGETEFFTYLGGSGEDRGFSIAAASASESDFCATVVGSTVSDDIETINPLNGGNVRKGNADLMIFTLCNASFTPNASNFVKSAPNAVRRGDDINYTITVFNDADNPVPVTITDLVPSEIIVTGVTGTGCSRTGNTVTCSFSAQPGNTTITIAGTVKNVPDPNRCQPAFITNVATLRVGSHSFNSSASTRLDCLPPPCGNGRLDPGEECDGTPNCRSNCSIMRCGDGIRDPGEQCDNRNANCVNCQIRLRVGDECGSGITGNCPPGTTCRRQCFVIECEYDWTNLWGLLADSNCGDSLCRTYKECVPD